MAIPSPGDTIGGIYRILAELGRGSMGVVFSAMDQVLGRKVAIKFIRTRFQTNDFRRRFKLEARAMALVGHPNVLAVHAFGEHEDTPFIVMELVEGQGLDRWCGHHAASQDLDTALRILDQVCLGVGAIHASATIHRDIKPSNILIDRDLRARVCDFGLAVCAADGERATEAVGTPGYMAPEVQFGREGECRATLKSDIYSLACVAYELLTGVAPFAADNTLALGVQHALSPVPIPSGVCPHLPKTFDRVLKGALEKDPAQRTASVEAFRCGLLAARSQSLEPVRILVAEDDPDFRELLYLVLRKAFPSADVECVADGPSALQAFDLNPPSVVIVDLCLPFLDGAMVTTQLRARHSSTLVPIIVLTGSGGPREWQCLSSLGADRFLVKPVNVPDLISTIQHAILQRSSGAGATN